MHISVGLSKPIHIPSVSFGGAKIACCAATLYALCLAAPAFYLANPAMRAYDEQEVIANKLHHKLLSHIRQQHVAVFAEARNIENADARTVFLQAALERANDDLAAFESLPTLSPADFGSCDTWFNRITGNRILALYKEEVRRRGLHDELAHEKVKELTQALRLCAARL